MTYLIQTESFSCPSTVCCSDSTLLFAEASSRRLDVLMIRVLALCHNGGLPFIYNTTHLLYQFKLQSEKKLSIFLHILLVAEAIAKFALMFLILLDQQSKKNIFHGETAF